MATETLPAAVRRARTMQVTVVDVVVETPDTVTLVYDGPDAREYHAGQFLTIDPHQFKSTLRFVQLMEVLKKRQEPPRAYSMASAPHEPLAITVKEETWTPGQDAYPTLLSPFLVHEVTAGMPMTISGFTGTYVLPDDIENRTDHIVHLCAGSGSVPNWSIVKSALRDHRRLRHTFLYWNDTWDDVSYRDALDALEVANPARLRVIHALTRQQDVSGLPAGVRIGGVSTDLVREVVPDFGTALFYACGPALSPWSRLAAKQKGVVPTPRFMENVHRVLKELGIPRQRFREECFG